MGRKHCYYLGLPFGCVGEEVLAEYEAVFMDVECEVVGVTSVDVGC